jgi:hypothetical protein
MKTQKEIEQFFKAKQERLESLQPHSQYILNNLPLESDLKKHPVFTDYASDIYGNVYSFKFNRITEISKAPHTRGYQQFRVHVAGEGRSYLVHRFVYECYNGMIKDGLQCHHIDHDKHNNSLENLKVVSQLENMKYGKEAGVLYGAANPKHPHYRN